MPKMHPNKAGHKVLADAMLPDIKKFIRKQKG
jgi:lysophospholipase L1-like esterase